VCGASGYIAAVTKVHCLYEVSCSLAMDRERVQGTFSRTDVRTLIKFNVLLGKSALECYKTLKEGLGTYAPSYETVCRWVNSIKNGREQTDDAPHSGAPTTATDECHVKQLKFVLEGTRSISCTAIATEVGISPASVYCILTNSLGERKVCAKWIPHVPKMTKEPCMFFSPTPICSVGEMKAMHSLIAF
jgi:transposase